MRINRALALAIGALAVTVTATGCGGSSTKTASDKGTDGKLTVGIKFDQPGLGLKTKDGSFSGFDVDVARYVATKLGIKPENVVFKESPSAQRETLIQNGQVDMV